MSFKDLDQNFSKALKILSYLLGPLAFILLLLLPLDISVKAQRFLSIFSLVVCLWLFTDVPLFISGTLGVSLSVIFGIVSPINAFAPFADPIIFLFLGGYILAKALEVTELDQRLAYKSLSHPWVQKSPQRIILVFLGLCFIMSMWISNTATVAMLLPLTFGVLKKLEKDFGIIPANMSEPLFLSLAYSATVGGNVTPIGSPPNVIAIGHLNNLTGMNLEFVQWMFMALPFSLIIFILIYKKCISHLPDQIELTPSEEVTDFRPFNNQQKSVLIVFIVTIFFWIFPGFVSLILPPENPVSLFIKNNLSASVVAIFFSSLLFLLPLNSKDKVLRNENISQLDWSSLLLFGSGLSLGKILFDTGLANLMAEFMSQLSGDFGTLFLIIALLAFTVIFTELASNTASANILIPIVIAISREFNFNSVVIAFCFALACNSAFMLPVATPPNVIIYGTNKVSKNTMMKVGLKLNLICIFILAITVIIFAHF